MELEPNVFGQDKINGFSSKAQLWHVESGNLEMFTLTKQQQNVNTTTMCEIIVKHVKTPEEKMLFLFLFSLHGMPWVGWEPTELSLTGAGETNWTETKTPGLEVSFADLPLDGCWLATDKESVQFMVLEALTRSYCTLSPPALQEGLYHLISRLELPGLIQRSQCCTVPVLRNQTQPRVGKLYVWTSPRDIFPNW